MDSLRTIPSTLTTMYGQQAFNRKFVYNIFFVYQPPFFKGQHGLMGRALGGWTFSSVFTAGSGVSGRGSVPRPEMDRSTAPGTTVNFFGNENAVPIGPVNCWSRLLQPSLKRVARNIFAKAGTAAINDFRNPILGLDNKDGGTGIVSGLPYWNMDFSIRKNFRVTEGISLEFQGVFANVFNHNQWLDPNGNSEPRVSSKAPSGFGALNSGSAQEQPGGNRQIEVGARVRF